MKRPNSDGWCGRPDLNRHSSFEPRDFHTTSAFAALAWHVRAAAWLKFLVSVGSGKDIENRDWRACNPALRFRGTCLIHAGIAIQPISDELRTWVKQISGSDLPPSLRRRGGDRASRSWCGRPASARQPRMRRSSVRRMPGPSPVSSDELQSTSRGDRDHHRIETERNFIYCYPRRYPNSFL